MQTFLPYPSFERSAKTLDYKRLGKQRVEAKQIHMSLTIPEYGWKHHPAVRMWKGYENALLLYGRTICLEWIARGYNDSLLKYFEVHHNTQYPLVFPPWLGDERVHSSHRACLKFKNCKYYPFKERMAISYFWPV